MTKTVGTDEVVFLTPSERKRLEEKRKQQNTPDKETPSRPILVTLSNVNILFPAQEMESQ
jgi:hypothetical protein